jgi:signal transduction histidine kinase
MNVAAKTLEALGIFGLPAPPSQLRGDRMDPRGSLFRKYVFYFFALVSTSLIVSGIVGLHYTYQESKAQRLSLQYEKAVAAASRIDAYLQEIERQLGWMRLPHMGAGTPEQRRIEYLKLLRQVPSIMDVSFVDETGHERLRVSRIGMTVMGSDIDFSQDPRFLEAKSGKTYISDVYFRKETEPYMTMAVAGLTEAAGVTIVEVNLKFILDVISRIKVGNHGLAYLVDRQGHLIAHPDISLVLQKTDLSALPQVTAALDGRATAAERVMMARDRVGREVLVAYASVEPLGWQVLVEQPLAEAFAPLYASLLRTALLLLAGLAFAAVVSLYFARRMVSPIRAIQAGAQRIAAGKLDQRIDVRTGDELEALAAEFNDMAKQLRESYASLERKVDERTRDLAESLEQQTATSETLKTISRSSFDLNRVLQELVMSAVKLGRADAGALYLKQPSGGYHLVAAYSAEPDLLRFLETQTREIHGRPNTATGRALTSGEAAQIEDVGAEPGYPWPRAGFATAFAVPILRDGSPIGTIFALKAVREPFTRKQADLISTFADQAGIAVENVRLFNEIREKSRQLELANRHKSEFLANVSHELRTPLNAIIGFSEVLLERMFGEINEKQAEYLDDIHSSGRHLLALINDILNLSKIEAGRMDLELSRFDLADSLTRSVGMVRERASRHGISVTLDTPPDLGDWVADERMFRQIMLNLLSNAVKFTPDHGRVTVTAARIDSRIEIAVADTGVGIAADHLGVIFDEFRQVGGSHPGKTEGTGLGLALTRRFIELHGGTIWVKSEVGVGSTFSFVLPESQPRTA